MWPYHPELLARPVPRYTSYPTAAEFHDGVGAVEMADALAAIDRETPISLYLHIPYCEQICWYCGCNTGRANKVQRLTAYLAALEAEISLVAKLLDGRGSVSRIAFGGGSPNAIASFEFVRLVDRVVTQFGAAHPPISVEVDPRGFTPEWARTMAMCGVTRVSMGVQTFAPHVQQAIGRVQPLEMIERCMVALRANCIDHINFDLMYGLPNQSLDDLRDTLDQAIRLSPSRIALFGYAHLPTMIPRQRRIDASNLPDADLRFEMAAMGHGMLVAAGYCPIGFDHFALPDDPLARALQAGTLRRNFQGFTEDDSDVLLGLGASAISSFPDRLIQNEKNPGQYRLLVADGRLPATRGIMRDAEEQARGKAIESILCRGEADIHGFADELLPRLAPFEAMGLVDVHGDSLTLSRAATPYARTIAATLDSHRAALSGHRFSNAV